VAWGSLSRSPAHALGRRANLVDTGCPLEQRGGLHPRESFSPWGERPLALRGRFVAASARRIISLTVACLRS